MSQDQPEPVRRLHHLLTEAVSCLAESSRSASNRSEPESSSSAGPSTSTLTRQTRSSSVSPSLAHRPFGSSSRSTSIQRQQERNSLFNYKRGTGRTRTLKRRRASWNHEFYCLSSTNQSAVPTALEKCRLISAGRCIYFHWKL